MGWLGGSTSGRSGLPATYQNGRGPGRKCITDDAPHLIDVDPALDPVGDETADIDRCRHDHGAFGSDGDVADPAAQDVPEDLARTLTAPGSLACQLAPRFPLVANDVSSLARYAATTRRRTGADLERQDRPDVAPGCRPPRTTTHAWTRGDQYRTTGTRR